MIKLYLKTLAIIIFFTLLVIFVYQSGFSYLTKENFNRINQLTSKGTFSYIQTIFAKTPESKWTSTLKKLQPGDEQAKIIPVESLMLNRKDKTQLFNGNIVFLPDEKFHFLYFLYYGIFEGFAVQRIAGSQYALEIMLTEPINETIKDTMRLMVHIISLELNNNSKDKWPAVLEKLQITFGLPLHLIPSNSNILTDKMRQDLNTYAVAYSEPETGNPISTIVFHISDPEKLLVIGPVQYSPMSRLFRVARDYYFISFATAAIFIVIFLTWLFSRNVLKIYGLTQKYSKGDFNVNTKIRRASILHGVYQNIIAMGDNLKRLIQSQQNMTRFVAHEVRTPLSTMQFALDSLKKDNNLSKKSHENLISIQEDIQAINKLISYFLLYYKTSAHELKCKTELLNISAWLETIVKKYALSKMTVVFVPCHPIDFHFDPRLLKHAVDNLITNALKFAKSKVIVSLEADKKNISIIVEDDGPGIPAFEIQNIFEPFHVLNESQEFGKHIGLGLTIAKSIVELHSGFIVFSPSEQLGGARFVIRFTL